MMTKAAVKDTQEISQEDQIVQISNTVENLDAESAHQALVNQMAVKGVTDFKLGGILARMQSAEHWKTLGDFTRFEDYLTERHGIRYRKATYLIKIYTNLVAADILWEQVENVGWSKLKEIVDVVTKETIAHWVTICETHNLLQIQQLVKDSLAGSLPSSGKVVSSPLSTMSFKVHDDQKTTILDAVEKAKLQASTEFKTVALEAICQNYLTGETIAIPSLSDAMEKCGIQDVISVMGELWPDVEVSIAMPNSMNPEEGAVEAVETVEDNMEL